MKLLEILTTLILSLTLVNSSELNSGKATVSSAPAQTSHHAPSAPELYNLFEDAVSKDESNQVRTLLETYVPLSQSSDETSQQATKLGSRKRTIADTNIPSQDEFDISYSALSAPELYILFKDAVSKDEPNQVRTLLETYVPLSQSPSKTLQQATKLGSRKRTIVDTNIPSQDEFDINSIIPDQGTLLHWAADCGHSDLIPMLIIRGADIDSKYGRFAMTPFMHAVTNGHDTVVAQFLDALATQPECIHSLVTTKSNTGNTALHYAASINHEAGVAQLLNALATQPERMCSLVTAQDNDGKTALHHAVKYGHYAVVARLLNTLAIHPERIYSLIMIQDNCGRTALHWAALGGHGPVVAQLLNALASDPERMHNLITTQNKHGWNALYYACINFNTSTVKMLLEHYKETLDKIAVSVSSSAVVLSFTCTDFASLVDREGKALDLAIIHDCTEIIDMLAQLGANLDVRDENGDTHLHRSARAGRSAVVTALVANHAESQRNNAGRTPHDDAQGLTPEALSLLEQCAERIILK